MAQTNFTGRFQATFTHFWTTHEINEYISYLTTYHSDICSSEIVGHSSLGQVIRALKISAKGKGQITGARPVIYIDAGVHAREWAAPMTAVYFMYAIVERHLINLDNLDFIIHPIVNPDGYDYSHTRVKINLNKI